jgi:tRNA 2-thiouridine synthesizing protein A
MSTERIIDARLMPPPEPFERTMEALDALPDGEILQLWLYRDPHPLYRALDLSGYRHQTTVRDDGTHVIAIWRGPPAAIASRV